MCALFGFLNYGKHVPRKILQKLVQALANASEVRGHHAAGIAYNKADTLTFFKRPKPAHKLHFHVPEKTTAVMGHTRLTTQGDQKKNYNNHPFRGFAGTEFALAHNGVLYNDELLRSQLQLPDTQIETDSYIAVQLIESQHELTFDSMRYTAESVRGYFTFTILDRRNNLFFVKGESPLYLIHFPSLGLYVYQYLKRQILRRGDTLVIKELDRLSRNKSDIKRELEIFKEMGVRVKILDIPTTLTDFPPEQLWVQDMINSILIEVLGSIAENERMKIRARQREGIEAAKKKNVRFGRPPKPLPDNWEKVVQAVKRGELRPVDAMRVLGITHSRFYRLLNSMK